MCAVYIHIHAYVCGCYVYMYTYIYAVYYGCLFYVCTVFAEWSLSDLSFVTEGTQ